MPTSTESSGNRKRYLFAMALLVAGLALSLFGPSGELTPARLFGAMLRPGSGDPESLIFWSLRVPRTLAVLLCGAALSAAGLLLQRTLHNDLASPGILGINAGAGFFALLAGLPLPARWARWEPYCCCPVGSAAPKAAFFFWASPSPP